jgi:hypothetical protein
LTKLTVIVDDVDNLRREVPFGDVWELAQEARQIVWPAKWPRDPDVKRIFVRGAILGLTIFDREWVLKASRGTRSKRPDTPSSYWVGSLRNGLVESQGFPWFQNLPEARSYISQIMQAVAAIADAVIAEYGGAADPVPVSAIAKVSAKPAAPDFVKDFRKQLLEQKRGAT